MLVVAVYLLGVLGDELFAHAIERRLQTGHQCELGHPSHSQRIDQSHGHIPSGCLLLL